MIKPIKQKKCKSCGDMFDPFSSLAFVCSMACSLDYVGKERMKKEKAAHAKRKKEFYQQDIAWQHAQCKKSFNRMRVLEELKWFKDRGQEPACISCARELGNDQWCCGHFKTVGSQGNLRYDRRNTYLQHNRYCNMGKSGDIEGSKTTMGYKAGLAHRFGESEAAEIIEYCTNTTETVKWDWEKMEADRKEWNARIRQLEKELEISN